MSARSRAAVAAASAALAFCACAAPRAAGPKPSRPPVILLSVDDLRADRVRPELMPRLAALASRAVVFEDAWAAATWTLPSHASMLTGLLPSRHGAGGSTAAPRPAAPGLTGAARWFKDAGYETAAFYGAPYLDPAFGLTEGFDLYESAGSSGLRRAAGWAAARAGRPFFLFLNCFEVHMLADAAADEPGGDRPSTRPAGYDEAARRFDEDLGRFLDALDRAGVLEKAVLAVTSDHGEALYDALATGAPAGHGGLPYPQVARVPWLLVLPGRRTPERVPGPVSGADLAPTLAAAAGVAVPAGLDGRSRLPGSPATAEPVFVEGDGWAALHAGQSELIRWTGGRQDWRDARPEGTWAALAGPPPEPLVRALAARLDAAALAPAAPAVLTPELRRRLKAAGYLP